MARRGPTPAQMEAAYTWLRAYESDGSADDVTFADSLTTVADWLEDRVRQQRMTAAVAGIVAMTGCTPQQARKKLSKVMAVGMEE